MKKFIAMAATLGLMAGLAMTANGATKGERLVSGTSYDAAKKILTVTFGGGETFEYAGVPQSVADELEKSGAKGKLFHELVKGKYPAVKAGGESTQPSTSGGVVNKPDSATKGERRVSGTAYDAAKKILTVTFAGGQTFEYAGVPQSVADELDKAGSKDNAFHELIKGKYPAVKAGSEATQPSTSTSEGVVNKPDSATKGERVVSGTSYDAAKKILTVTFAGGEVYEYGGVPQSVADELAQAESKGKAFNDLIKGKFPAMRK